MPRKSVTVTRARARLRAQDVGGLATLEPGVDGHQHRPGLEEAQDGDDPLGAVEGPDGHPVARLDAGRHQGGRRSERASSKSSA